MPAHGQSNWTRRASAAVVTAVTLALLIGFASLAIDVGYLYSVKAELQRAADASALSGAAAFLSEEMLVDNYSPTEDVYANVQLVAAQNAAGGLWPNVDQADIIMGRLQNPTDPDEAIDVFNMPYNTVQVTVRRDASMNSEVPLFFARIFGFQSAPVSATATAAVEDTFSGYRPPAEGKGPLLPLSVDVDKYSQALTAGDDLWSWDGTLKSPVNASDGLRELWLYPEYDHGNPNEQDLAAASDGAGNFGTLNIGLVEQGTAQLGAQIEHGVSEKHLINEIGTPNVEFFDAQGDPLTYTMTGNPGLSGAVSAHIELRIGDVVGFFLHDSLIETGSGAEYNITGLRFGRLMEVDLTGNPADKRVVIQPVPYAGPGVQTRPGVGSSGGMMLSVRLIR